MFTFLATIFSAVFIAEHWIEILIAICAIIFLIKMLRRAKRNRAAQAEQAKKQSAYRAAYELEQQEKYQARMAEEKQKSEIESAIARNPYSSEYRVPIQQNDINIRTLDYLDFYQESSGSFVALDFETTGIDYHNHEIVEIGAVKVSNWRIVDKYQQYVNPGMSMPSAASAVNHITDDMLIGKPRIYEVLPDLLHFIGSDIIVAHNASFDMHFLSMACMRYRFSAPTACFDSMDLKIVWPDLKSRSLSSFLSAAGVENKNAHSALGDAEALAELMLVSMQKKTHFQLPDDFDYGFSTGHFSEPVEKIDNLLSGKRFVITGEIIGHERYDVEKLIALHGGKATLKISNATDYLVVGVYRKLPSSYISAKEAYADNLISEGWKIQKITPVELFSMMNEDL